VFDSSESGAVGRACAAAAVIDQLYSQAGAVVAEVYRCASGAVAGSDWSLAMLRHQS
jgi:hypothetical protein